MHFLKTCLLIATTAKKSLLPSKQGPPFNEVKETINLNLARISALEFNFPNI